MTIDIICPLYQAENYIEKLHASLLKQEKVEINSIQYILTRSKDHTQKWLDDHQIPYTLIEKEEFSHSLTREKAAFNATGDILVFITQDIHIVDEFWLYHLVRSIIDGDCVASYSRQLCDNQSIEKYTREKNYADHSYYKDQSNIPELGLYTFFFSDASSAILKEVFIQLNGYDQKDLPTNEDMYIAHKIILAGYRIKYCSDSKIIHSHPFHFKTLYKRYKDTGTFFKMEPVMNQYGTMTSGKSMAIYILKRIIEDRNYQAALEFIPNMLARLIGMKMG